ncbi:MAG TPA: flagellar assembly protein FliH [Gammaproteobacteria bacterium]|nr:flagellar assembly protein FliH [Gammaproteobacteria bacterium]
MQKNSSRIIDGDGLSGIERWRQPDVGAGQGRAGAAGMMTAGELERIQQQAYEEGLALGRREGLAEGRARIQSEAGRLAEICALLGRPLAEMDEEVVEEITALAIAVARQIIRRELKTDPGQVVATVRQALEALPLASREVRIFLHPEDLALVRDSLSGVEGEGWQLREDPSMGRGGCRVVTHSSRIDATVEKRLAAIASELLGRDREDDSSTE